MVSPAARWSQTELGRLRAAGHHRSFARFRADKSGRTGIGIGSTDSGRRQDIVASETSTVTADIAMPLPLSAETDGQNRGSYRGQLSYCLDPARFRRRTPLPDVLLCGSAPIVQSGITNLPLLASPSAALWFGERGFFLSLRSSFRLIGLQFCPAFPLGFRNAFSRLE